jgi:low affinity Fe/Cu permease
LAGPPLRACHSHGNGSEIFPSGARREPLAVNLIMTREKQAQHSPVNGKSVPWFTRFARWTANHAGRPSAFVIATVVVLAWAFTGPIFDFSDTWQLVINTSTTIVTFLMVFLIQNTQNRDSQALHLKLDELIRAKKGARNTLLDLDDLSDEELAQIRMSFAKIAAKAKDEVRDGSAETEVIAITRKK